MSKRPPLCTTGKIALAGKRNRERQLLDRKQRALAEELSTTKKRKTKINRIGI